MAFQLRQRASSPLTSRTIELISIPELEDDDVKLRPFQMEDAPRVAELCGEWEVAATTANIPHPYDQAMAEEWIATHAEAFEEGTAVTFAVTRAADGELVGAVGMHINKPNRLAEIGYWIGKPYWNQGYATRAARTVIEYGFDHFKLNRIQARHMTVNPASGRVMEKAGMKFEGILRQSIYRWDSFEDSAIYSILRDEFEETRRG